MLNDQSVAISENNISKNIQFQYDDDEYLENIDYEDDDVEINSN